MRTTVREDKQIEAFLVFYSQSTRPAQCYCVNRAQTGVVGYFHFEDSWLPWHT
jgi:hypothetical protein